MLRHQFQNIEEEKRYNLRLAVLCFQRQRETGLATPPPLVKQFELIKQRIVHEGNSKSEPISEETLSEEEAKALLPEVITKQDFICIAIKSLRQMESWNARGSHAQEDIQIIARETCALMLLLNPVFKKDSPGGEALERLRVIRSNLLKKFTDLDFLLPHRLQDEQQEILYQQHRRVFKYLGELQATISELTEIIKHPKSA